jgi:hypothetical protein
MLLGIPHLDVLEERWLFLPPRRTTRSICSLMSMRRVRSSLDVILHHPPPQGLMDRPALVVA